MNINQGNELNAFYEFIMTGKFIGLAKKTNIRNPVTRRFLQFVPNLRP
jgi:hypothetical protein